jgi:hypothetical protein
MKNKNDIMSKIITRKVTLQGLTDIMFARYPGDNKTTLHWHQKVYLIPGTSTLCLPATNISSFLSATNTISAPVRLRGRRGSSIARSCLSFVTVSAADDKSHPQYLPFLRNGNVIEMGNPSGDTDEKSGLYKDFRVARLAKGIPNPQERPVLPMDWALQFKLSILPNQEIKEDEIYNLLVEGGLAIGLGTYRGVFGKFAVTQWE